MSYCTEQDLLDRIGFAELLDLTDEHNTGDIDSTRLNRAIDDVDGLIDGYLSGRYTLPLSSAPKVLTRVACDIVRFDLYDHAPEPIARRFELAVQYLRDAAAGRVSLGVDSDGSEPPTDSSASMSSGGNVFNRNDTGFI